MKKFNKKQIIIVSSIIIILILSAISAVLVSVLNTSKITIYNNTVELGDKSYEEKLLIYTNIYVKEGVVYEIKQNNIDIENIGDYTIIFDIKFKGKVYEEIKKIKVVDTTPPVITLTKKVFYIEDKINFEDIIKIKDNELVDMTYQDANVVVEWDNNTTKEEKKQIKISATDSSGNISTQDFEIDIKNPMVSIYEYIKEIVGSKYTFDNTSESQNKIVLKFTQKFGNMTSSGWINYTEKIYYQYTTSSYGSFATLVYFDNNYNPIQIKDVSSTGKVSNINVGSKDAESFINIFNSDIKSVKILFNNQIDLINKTIDVIKNETIDMRKIDK